MRREMSSQASGLTETASKWALLAKTGLGPQDEARLALWLDEAAEHRAAYEAVLAADQALKRHEADAALTAMRMAALRVRPEQRWSARSMAAGLAAGIVLVGTLGWWGAGQFLGVSLSGGGREQIAQYATAAGERATVTLADGSVLILNTDSAAEIAFDRRARTVRLVKGQAQFSVAHDASRPFEVLADGRQVTAVGTAFDVLLLPDALRVAMLDGVVRVSSEHQNAVQILSKGEVMTAHTGQAVVIRKADTARLAGWRDGVVYFDETPLREAVEEISRYTRQPVVVGDDQAGALRVSGAFRITEADAFAETMTDIFPLSAKHSANGRTILSSARM